MNKQLSRENHYVPKWYQRRFLTDNRDKLFYLYIDNRKRLPDGRIISCREVSERYPSQCFWTLDLYTTQFREHLNDEIERLLMGSIDSKGAAAVSAILCGNPRDQHFALLPFFEYLDAQKLRTPKGLDWIKSKYPRLTQAELMIEMQGLRQMHCTMWSEAVREIISAEESDVKFIVTDHPVTIYNAAFPPQSSTCSYPNEPPIEMIGSQTVFALDKNYCLILTNLEYAKSPGDADLTARRTNPRYRGQTIVRTDAYIRSRKLRREDVIAINYLLKSRAHKFIAAGSKEWLYPEKQYSGDWSAIGQLMLPKDELWKFGGEVYVGYEDGTVYYQDEFGRTSGSHNYVQKKLQVDIKPNDLCGCGSGRIFDECCQGRPEQDRPAWDVYSIRERNLIFSQAVKSILGLDKGKTWDDVRRDLSDDQVKEIHEVFSSGWPKDTDIASLLPRPDNMITRGIYLGFVDPRSIVANGVGLLTYFNEIILPNPFINPVHVRPTFSPTESPTQYKEQTLKNVILLLTLEPFIYAGMIHLIPDPMDFNADLRRQVWSMAKQRTKNFEPSKEDMRQFKYLHRDDINRLLRRLPEKAQRQRLRQIDPDLKDEEIEQILALTKKQNEEDPFALMQPVEPGESGAQLTITKGFNLEIALFLAGLTGSFVYTDMLAHWKHLHEHTRAAKPKQKDASVTAVIEDIKSIKFPIQIDADEILKDRLSGSQSALIRNQFDELLKLISDSRGPDILKLTVEQLGKAAEGMRRLWQDQNAESIFDMQFALSVASAGFENNEIRRLTVTFGRAKDVQNMPIAMYLHV